MAGNNSLQMLRGTSSAIAASTATLLAGQPLYDMTNNLLYVGNGSINTIKTLTPTYAAGIKSISKYGSTIASLDFSDDSLVSNANALYLGGMDNPYFYADSSGGTVIHDYNGNGILLKMTEGLDTVVSSLTLGYGAVDLNASTSVNMKVHNSPFLNATYDDTNLRSVSLSGAASTLTVANGITLDHGASGVDFTDGGDPGLHIYNSDLTSTQKISVKSYTSSTIFSKVELSTSQLMLNITDASNLTRSIEMSPTIGGINLVDGSAYIKTRGQVPSTYTIDIDAPSGNNASGALRINSGSTMSLTASKFTISLPTTGLYNTLSLNPGELSVYTSLSLAQPTNNLIMNSSFVALGRTLTYGLVIKDSSAYFGSSTMLQSTSTSDTTWTNYTKFTNGSMKVVGSSTTYVTEIIPSHGIRFFSGSTSSYFQIGSTGLFMSRQGSYYTLPIATFTSSFNILGLQPKYNAGTSITSTASSTYYFCIQGSGVSSYVSSMRYFYRGEDNSIASGNVSTLTEKTIWSGKGGICGEGYVINPTNQTNTVMIRQCTTFGTRSDGPYISTMEMPPYAVCKFFLYRPTATQSSAFFIRFA